MQIFKNLHMVQVYLLRLVVEEVDGQNHLENKNLKKKT
jgi:hypothetical protein